MKKITLLFTLLCMAALNGMENPERGDYKGLGGLSPELQVMIIHALSTYNNFENMINAIKATRLVDKELNEIVDNEYNNPDKFYNLMYTLEKKFISTLRCSEATHIYIAKRLGTSAAKRYLQVWNGSEKSKEIIRYGYTFNFSTAKIKELICDGADINYFEHQGETPLLLALQTGMPAASIQLLLEYGANPNVTDTKNKGVFEYLDLGYPQKIELYRIQKPKIKQLLEEAIKKNQKETL